MRIILRDYKGFEKDLDVADEQFDKGFVKIPTERIVSLTVNGPVLDYDAVTFIKTNVTSFGVPVFKEYDENLNTIVCLY